MAYNENDPLNPARGCMNALGMVAVCALLVLLLVKVL